LTLEEEQQQNLTTTQAITMASMPRAPTTVMATPQAGSVVEGEEALLAASAGLALMDGVAGCDAD